MQRRQLPPNPKAARTLTDSEADRIDSANLTDWTSPARCKTCGGKGWFVTSSERGQKMTRDTPLVEYDCDCRSQWLLHRWLLRSGIGYHYQTLSWADTGSVSGQALSAVGEYLNGATSATSYATGRGLTLWSPTTGTGKTLVAVLALKALLDMGHDGYFVQFNDLIDHSTDGWRDVEERKWFNRRIRNAEVLVMDDLGRENPGRSNVVEAMLDSVIRSRIASGRPTIITTNKSPEQMRVGYGGNILSLLSEVNRQVHFTGADYRSTHNEQVEVQMALGVSYPVCVG